MSIKSILTPSLILKRTNIGETDRIVTLLTRDKGKLTVIAKGCRKMSSSKRGHLEPGNLIDAYLIPTKSMPILTQTRLHTEFTEIKRSLIHVKKLFQILEMLDVLTVENAQDAEETFVIAIQMLTQLNTHPDSHHAIKNYMTRLLKLIGFQQSDQTKYSNLTEFISSVAEHPLRSYQYLTVR